MTPVTVNAATPDDLDALLESVAGLFREDACRRIRWWTPAGRPATAPPTTPPMTGRACLLALARDGDRVIGHLVGRLSGPSAVRTGNLAVLESMRVARTRAGPAWAACSSGTSSTGPATVARSRPALPRTPPTTRRGVSMHGTASSRRASSHGQFSSGRSRGRPGGARDGAGDCLPARVHRGPAWRVFYLAAG